MTRNHVSLFTCISAVMMVLLALSGCSFEGWDYTYDHHHVGTGYDGELDFTLLETSSPIAQRCDHASVIFQDKLWVFGGYNPNARGDEETYLDDVWYSEDGYTWMNITQDAPWDGRRGHQVVVYNDRLYLIGGFRVFQADGITYGRASNDVWSSLDGLTWVEEKPHSYKTLVTHPGIPPAQDVRGTDLYDPSDDLDWYPRLDHTVVVYDYDRDGTEELCLLGGFAKEQIPYLNDSQNDETRKYFADIWTSPDGRSWTQQEPLYLDEDDAQIYGKYAGGRSAFAHFIEDGSLHISGGTSRFTFQETGQGFVIPNWDRVWFHGESGWEYLPQFSSEYLERRDHEIVTYQGDHWILPGSKPAAIQWYKGADSIWRIDGATLMASRDGSYEVGSPMYGIANYTAEVFTPQVGEFAGTEAIFVIFGDGDGGVRNTIWHITKKEDL